MGLGFVDGTQGLGGSALAVASPAVFAIQVLAFSGVPLVGAGQTDSDQCDGKERGERIQDRPEGEILTVPDEIGADQSRNQTTPGIEEFNVEREYVTRGLDKASDVFYDIEQAPA